MKSSLFWLVAAVLLVAVPGFAQTDEKRVRVSFGAGVSGGGDEGDPSLLFSAGYRFSSRFSFDVELTTAEGPGGFRDPRILAGEIDILPTGFISGTGIGSQTGTGFTQVSGRARPVLSELIAPGFGDEGETMIGTAGFRYELPTQTDRFRPYLGGGIGMSRTEFETIFPIRLPGISNPERQAPAVGDDDDDDDNDADEFSRTGVAFSAGVGASLRVYKGLSIDLDARYFWLDSRRNLGSFGGGVSYRF